MEIVIGGIVFLWGSVGGFDWVGDMVNCISYKQPIIDPMQQKITLTLTEYLKLGNVNITKTSAGPSCIISAQDILNEVNSNKINKVVETVATPEIKIIGIDTVKENLSESWKKTSNTVLRLN